MSLSEFKDETEESATSSVAKFNSPEGNPHGKVICISSPNDRSGKFFELYQRSMEKDCTDWLMIQAEYLRNKYTENPVSYNSEFGAEFSDRVTG